MNDFYWELILHDGTRHEIPPDKVEVVKRRMNNREAINLSTAMIPFAQIQTFRLTDKPYSVQPLIDAVAQAFNDPQIADDGAIKAQWVKKKVTNDKWNRYYGANPAYRKLGDEAGMVVIAFRLPIHQIDITQVAYCDVEEVRRLS